MSGQLDNGVRVEVRRAAQQELAMLLQLQAERE